MKYTFAFIAVLCVTSTLGAKVQLHETMENMLQMASKAQDAAEKVMRVLNDLRASVDDEEAKLRQQHDQEEDFYAKSISDLTGIANTNCGIYDAAVANREFIEAEIADTAAYLEWITGRFEAIDDLIQTLKDERCEASNVFVLRVRENYEAMDAITLLKYELQQLHASGQVSMVELDDMPSYNRLLAYTHMFKDNALKEFEQLADTEPATRRADPGDDHVDNTRGEQQLESFQGDDRGNVIVKMLNKLDELEAHLKKSLDQLRDNELRAAYDTVKYIQEAEKEVHYLQSEESKREAYALKLDNDLTLALATEQRTHQTCEDSKKAVEDRKAEREAHRAFFMKELDRLRGDAEVVDEIITIFNQELKGIDDVIRDQVGEYQMDDERFSQGMFRRTDAQASKYEGGITDYILENSK